MNRNIRVILNFPLALLAVPIVLLLTVDLSSAANHYVRSGATGDGSGSDWTNACVDFAGSCAVSSLVRGDTYYVAGGTYARLILNKATSGTSIISILGATAADHGTNTGWQASYGVDVAQAQFTYSSQSAVEINTSYWVFDGRVGSGNTASSYGFRVLRPTDCNTPNQILMQVPNPASTISNITVKYVAAVGCGAAFNQQQVGIFIGCGACYVTNSEFSHSFFDGHQNSWAADNVANSLFEYNWSQNQWSSSSHHGETMVVINCSSDDQAGCSSACARGFCNYNNTFRYNIIKNCRGTACMAALDPGLIGMNTWSIYGNVFVDASPGNGIISTGTSASIVIANTSIYNNTVINSPVGRFFWQCGSPTPCANATGNVVKNNLLWNSGTQIEASTGGSIDHDYNTFLSAVDSPPAEPHGQIGGFNPFVNSAIGDVGNYNLIQVAGAGPNSVNVGLTLPSPFNIDMTGRTRGSDGTWERGAFEFALGGIAPSAPGSLRVQ